MTKHECEPFQGKLPRGLGQYRKRITDYFKDSDGVWVYYVPGWKREIDHVHFSHVDPEDGETLQDLIEDVKSAVKCTCVDCRAYIKEYKERTGK
jgi:hypothetical protein